MMRELLTPPQVAEMLGVDPCTVREWIRSGELPGVNLASDTATRPRFRVRPEDLDAFLERRSVSPPPEPRRRRRKPTTATEYY